MHSLQYNGLINIKVTYQLLPRKSYLLVLSNIHYIIFYISVWLHMRDSVSYECILHSVIFFGDGWGLGCRDITAASTILFLNVN